jgi:DNA replicative helicase MCM subunit Mcm2 (Cdc46/Mcm family)
MHTLAIKLIDNTIKEYDRQISRMNEDVDYLPSNNRHHLEKEISKYLDMINQLSKSREFLKSK